MQYGIQIANRMIGEKAQFDRLKRERNQSVAMIEEFPSFAQHIYNSISRTTLELLAEGITGRNSERNVTR
jgi:hypothetical protein